MSIDLEAVRARAERCRAVRPIAGEVVHAERIRDAFELAEDVPALLAEIERLTLAHTTVSVGLEKSGEYGRWAQQEIARLTAERDEARSEVDRVWTLLQNARQASRRVSAALISSEPRLRESFTNADTSPWDRFVAPSINALRAALGLRGVNGEQIQAELSAERAVIEAAKVRAQVLRDLQVCGSGSDGWHDRDRESDRAILAAVDALAGQIDESSVDAPLTGWYCNHCPMDPRTRTITHSANCPDMPEAVKIARRSSSDALGHPVISVAPQPAPGERKLPVCAACGHRHRWGGECADHTWGDSCAYEAGADCPKPGEAWPNGRSMMATTATHVTGDLSRDEPDLAVVFDEDGDDYVGNWRTGFGFINVRFPKATTRELTAEERDRFAAKVVTGPGGYESPALSGPEDQP